MTDKPNIVVLMPDQLRADCLGVSGHPIVRTPNIDALASDGVRFANAYTTCPFCMPARSSFHSGLFCHNHGQWGNYGHLPADVDTYARRLRAAGYHTCHVGKSHLYPQIRGEHMESYKPFLNALGFDDSFECGGPHAQVGTLSILSDRWEKLGIFKTFREDYAERGKDPIHNQWPSPMPPGETLDDFAGRTAVEYVEGYRRSEPMMMFVGFPGPHEPWDPPADWAALYAGMPMDAPDPVTDPPPWLSPAAAEHHRKMQTVNPAITPEVVANVRRLYYGKISHIDHWIGRIIKALKDRGMYDNTLVILWSDHGEMLWDKMRHHKSVFYEQSVHIPLIIRPPKSAKVARGKTSDGLVSQVDCVPTMIEFGGAAPMPHAFGRSLSGVLADPKISVNEAVFSEIDKRTMVRDGRFKAVIDNRGELLKLYDMIEDPKERVNLAGKPGTEETVRSLRERILNWLLATPNEQK